MRQGMYYTTILHIWYKDYFILYLLYFYIEKLFISVRGNQLLLQMNLNRCRDFSHLSRFFWELSNFVINEWFVVGILRVSPSLSLCLPAVFQFFPRPEKREAYEKMCSRKFDIFFIYVLPFRGKNYEKTLREKRKNNARQAGQGLREDGGTFKENCHGWTNEPSQRSHKFVSKSCETLNWTRRRGERVG